MYTNSKIPVVLVALCAAALLVGGCGASKQAGRIGSGAGALDGDGCDMQAARSRALGLLDKAAAARASNPVRAANYEQRASQIISGADACERRRSRKSR